MGRDFSIEGCDLCSKGPSAIAFDTLKGYLKNVKGFRKGPEVDADSPMYIKKPKLALAIMSLDNFLDNVRYKEYDEEAKVNYLKKYDWLNYCSFEEFVDDVECVRETFVRALIEAVASKEKMLSVSYS